MEVDNQIEEEVVEQTTEDAVREAIESLKAPVEPVAQPSVPRDDAGKFAAKTTDAPARDTLTLPVKTGDVNAPVVAVPETPVVAPKGLKPEFKAKFGELSPDWQAEINRREADAAKVLAAQDEERLLGKKVNEMATPYLPTIRAEGATVEKAFQDYLQTAHVLRSGNDFQKAQSIAAVIGQFKVNPNILLSILQGGNVNNGVGSPQGQNNLAYDALQRELAEMKGQLQGFTQQRQLQEEQSLLSKIEEFSSKPGHEHFDRVRTQMGVLLENGIAKDLEDAYDRAVYADPEIRSTLISAQQQISSGQRLSETKVRTEAARRASGSVTGGPGSAKALNGAGANVPIEETIRAALRESQGRV